jgi:hypothetical protein
MPSTSLLHFMSMSRIPIVSASFIIAVGVAQRIVIMVISSRVVVPIPIRNPIVSASFIIAVGVAQRIVIMVLSSRVVVLAGV